MFSSTTLLGDSDTVERRYDNDTTNPIPLENSWCWWYDKYIGPGKSPEEYAAAVKLLGTVSTVQEFWRWYNNLPPIDHIVPGSSLHLHKKGIKPLW